MAAADRIKTRIMRLLCALLRSRREDGGQDGASDENRVRKRRFHLIEQRWHVEKICRESIGTLSSQVFGLGTNYWTRSAGEEPLPPYHRSLDRVREELT